MAAAVVAHQRGRLDEARTGYERLLAAQPTHADAIHYLGLLSFQTGDFAGAVDCIGRAIALRADVATYHVNFGNALKRLDRAEEALAAYDHALALEPGHAAGLYNKALLLHALQRTEQAISVLQKLLAAAPHMAQAWEELGRCLFDEEAIDAAFDAFAQAIRLDPRLGGAHLQMGAIQLRFGDTTAALRAFEAAERLPRHAVDAAAMRLFALAYTDISPDRLRQQHEQWTARHCPPVVARPAPRARRSDEPLRVGFMSPDFRRHAMRFFVRPIFAALDRKRIEPIVFSTCRREQQDDVTAELRRLVPNWVDCGHLDDPRLAECIADAQLDVLVDLAGHTAGGRMQVLARRPAPVQCTMLGYMTTLGAPFIDARLTDAVAVPMACDQWFSERLIRLPDSQWCFAPDEGTPPVLSRDPGSAGVCYGAFHTTAKVNPRVLSLWVRLLQEQPNASLTLVGWGTRARDYLARPFREAGLEARLTVAEPRAYADYLDLYREIDVSLDCFPYSGGTVICESLWMGVPVLTIAHDSPAGRGGASILSAAGLPDWVAMDEADFLARARRFAEDRNRLAELRGSLREHLQASPLMDAARYARGLESALVALSEI